MLRDHFLIPDATRPVVDWAALRDRFPWVAALHECPQDPVHHPEGDVGTHTRLALEALVQLPAWQAADPDSQAVVFVATLCHDIGKPATTRSEGDRVTSPGHARAGALLTRRLLWELGADVATREAVAGLVRWHMRPNFLLGGDSRCELYRVSMTARWDHLLLLAAADAGGRGHPVPTDKAELLEFLGQYAEEEHCLSAPRAFANDRSRVLYFAREERDPDYAAHDDTWGEVLLVAGLPGTGKSTWLAKHHPALPQVCRDDIRQTLRLDPGEDEHRVAREATAIATEYLRRRQPFAWNATHLVRDLRTPVIALTHRYHARIRVVQLEVDAATQRAWNAGRPEHLIVPDRALDRMLSRWDVPDRTEVEAIDVIEPHVRVRGAQRRTAATAHQSLRRR